MKKNILIYIIGIACVVTVSLGCAKFWGKGALTIESFSSISNTKRALVVLFPGFGGEGIYYEQQGCIEAMRERGFDADILILNVKPRIYIENEIIEMMKTEIISPAKALGYKHIYLVGISMGGHGVLLYVTKYPEDIDAVLILSPFISGPRQTNAIIEAGGIENWEHCPFVGWDQACRLWQALKVYTSDPERCSNIFLGYGTEDVFVKECRVLAGLLPPEHVFTVPGKHNWTTWKKLWIIAMDYFKVLKAERMKQQKTQ